MANIRTSHKSGFLIRGGSRRRETLWLGGTVFRQTLAAVTSVALVQVLNAAALALRPFTIVRTRGQLNVHSDQSGASQSYGASYGDAVVSEQASTIGVTAVPTPTVDSSSDLWSTYEMMISEFVFGSAASFIAAAGITRIIDSKAMRKVEDGQDLVAVVEGPGAGLTGGSIISGFTRVLIKLH